MWSGVQLVLIFEWIKPESFGIEMVVSPCCDRCKKLVNHLRHLSLTDIHDKSPSYFSRKLRDSEAPRINKCADNNISVTSHLIPWLGEGNTHITDLCKHPYSTQGPLLPMAWKRSDTVIGLSVENKGSLHVLHVAFHTIDTEVAVQNCHYADKQTSDTLPQKKIGY